MGETSWFDALKGFGSSAMGWLGDGKNLQGLGSLVGGIGGAYGALEQGKQAKALLNLQTGAYNDEKKRREKAQLAIDGVNWGVAPTAARLELGA